MAGSLSSPHSVPDSSIEARLEGLKLLAHCLDEPIVIFNPRMEMVYANPSAGGLTGVCPLVDPQRMASERDPVQDLPCEPCPGKALFSERVPGQDISFRPDLVKDAHRSCPLPQAIPLGHENGAVHYAVMMGARGRQSVVRPSSHMGLPSSEALEKAAAPEKNHDIPLIGESTIIQQLVEMIRLVAASEATVLIQGESGTGKELVAKTIHALSRRRSHPFVVVECSALPETLLESELFGHVRGAFTGAVADRKGLFEEAEGGTIFLDEIADTSPAFQARLLRVLQEGEIRPVGSNQSIKVDVRVISAGNKPIEELIKDKLFRADLYYRLAVLPLTVPPLRERQEDIPLLVRHFLAKSSARHNRSLPSVSPEILKFLVQQPWGGNVRELENLIERLVVTSAGSVIHMEKLVGQGNGGGDLPTKNLKSIGKSARQDAERLRILDALREANGDRTRTARILKISRSSLYNKLRDYQIS